MTQEEIKAHTDELMSLHERKRAIMETLAVGDPTDEHRAELEQELKQNDASREARIAELQALPKG